MPSPSLLPEPSRLRVSSEVRPAFRPQTGKDALGPARPGPARLQAPTSGPTEPARPTACPAPSQAPQPRSPLPPAGPSPPAALGPAQAAHRSGSAAQRLGGGGCGAGRDRRRAEPPPSSFVRALFLVKGLGGRGPGRALEIYPFVYVTISSIFPALQTTSLSPSWANWYSQVSPSFLGGISGNPESLFGSDSKFRKCYGDGR